MKGKNYVIMRDGPNEKTGQLFDYEDYIKFSKLNFIGLLTKNDKGQLVLRMKKDKN